MSNIHEALEPLTVPIDDLIQDPANARTHDPRNIEAIAASLERFGQTKPVVLHKNGKTIIAGNGTWQAAKRLGWTRIAATRTTLTSAEAIAYGIADNKTAELAAWEDDTLRNLIGGLPEELQLATGFDDKEIEDLLRETIESVEEDEIPETPEEATTKTGDLWILGEHRLLCGDCCDEELIRKHKDNLDSDIAFTSPPYALGSSIALSGNKNMSKKGNAYDTHDDSVDTWSQLMDKFFDNSRLVSRAQFVNVQMLANNKRLLVEWINNKSEHLVDVAVWNKGHGAPAMAKGVLTSAFEFVFIFGDKDASRVVPYSSWHGNKTNVVDVPPQRNNDFASIHGATMPLEFARHFVADIADKSKSVFDPFAGTGTTLIVCEQVNKRFAGIEIDPKYCDVIVQRWEQQTGKKAERHSGGE